MKYINKLLLFFLFCTASATEFSPWFPPLFELENQVDLLFEQVKEIQTPLGSFSSPTSNASLHLASNLTPWPHWNLEAELLLTHTQKSDFDFEAALVTLRRGWFEDSIGAPVSFATGVTFAFPSHAFLHQYSFAYHGSVNAEFHAALGKEWACSEEWLMRLWSLAGFGVANRGSPWLHGLIGIEIRTSSCSSLGIAAEALYGLGKEQIVPLVPFDGYARIAHRSVDLGGLYSYCFHSFGTLSIFAWYNLYAHNFAKNYYGATLSLSIPLNALDLVPSFLF